MKFRSSHFILSMLTENLYRQHRSNIMKKCFKCQEQKPLSDIYKHPMMADGHVNKCKECNKRDVRENRAARLSYYRAYDKARNKDPSRWGARQVYNALKERPGEVAESMKRGARVALGNAVRDGKVPKPPECKICGAPDGRLHGHHEDYSRPLMVIWCCSGCHSLIHSYWRAREGIVDHASTSPIS